jgi:Mrp family chromosome partitioning ATPase
MSGSLTTASGEVSSQSRARRVVMITSPGEESTLEDVAFNLAAVCAEVGQKVVLLNTAIFRNPAADEAESPMPPLWWLNWPAPQGTKSTEEERHRLQTADVRPAEIEALLGETGVPGVRRLDLRYFVNHTAQVVIRVPEVIAALQQIVDVIIIAVPSYLTVHHGEGLTPFADVVLVVGERNSTTMDALRRTRAALTRLAAPVAGVVLSGEHQEEEEWGAESEDESEPDRMYEDTYFRQVRFLGDENEESAVARGSHVSLEDHSQGNGATGNGAKGHDPVDAGSARRASPEA